MRQAAAPGPADTSINRPRRLPGGSGMGCEARARAQVASAHFRFSIRRAALRPAPTRAAASATLWQPTSWNNRSRGVGDAVGLRLQFTRRKEPGGDPQRLRKRDDCRLVRLEVKGKNAADRLGHNSGFLEHSARQILERLRVAAADATDPKRGAPGNESEAPLGNRLHAGNHIQRSLPPRIGCEPIREADIGAADRQ